MFLSLWLLSCPSSSSPFIHQLLSLLLKRLLIGLLLPTWAPLNSILHSETRNRIVYSWLKCFHDFLMLSGWSGSYSYTPLFAPLLSFNLCYSLNFRHFSCQSILHNSKLLSSMETFHRQLFHTEIPSPNGSSKLSSSIMSLLEGSLTDSLNVIFNSRRFSKHCVPSLYRNHKINLTYVMIWLSSFDSRFQAP